MEFFKQVLEGKIEEDKLEEVLDELNKSFPKNFIPKSKFNEINEELKLTKQQLDESQGLINQLTEKASSIEEYEKRIAELKIENDNKAIEYQRQIEEVTLNTQKELKKSKIKELLLLNNAHEHALDLLTKEYAEVAEWTEEGLVEPEKLIEKIRSERAGLFINEKVESTEKGKKAKPNDDEMSQLRKWAGLKD